MPVSILLLLIITAGGFGLSYLISRDAPMLWRLACGNVVGSAVFGTVLFAVSFIFGFGVASAVVSLIITLLPLILFRKKDFRNRAPADWRKANGKLRGGNLQKGLRFLYYTFFFVLFWLFFQQAMYETARGIFTGASQNLGDLPFHLGTIFGFTDGNNFPPQNPSFAGAKFSYPFIADLITAAYIKIGADIENSLFVQNVSWAFSLLVILERFVFKITRDAFAGKIAAALLFFSGGFGFFVFLSDYWHQTGSFFEYLQHLPYDYTIGDKFRWGNSLVVLFITQRSFLLGAPLTLVVLDRLWKIFNAETTTPSIENHPVGETPPPLLRKEGSKTAAPPKTGGEFFSASPRLFVSVSFFVGILAGTLPLIHLHSLAVLFIVTVCLFIAKPEKWLEWGSFGVGVCLIAVPELIWSITGTATRTSEFYAWFFGWNKGDASFVWFWFINTGITIPAIIAGLLLVYFTQRRKDSNTEAHGYARRFVAVLHTIFSLLYSMQCGAARSVGMGQYKNPDILVYRLAAVYGHVSCVDVAKECGIEDRSSSVFYRSDFFGSSRRLANGFGPDKDPDF